MKHTKTRQDTSNNQGKGTYLADLEVRRPMKLQGTVEVALNLRADLVLRLPGRFLLPLVAEKLQGDPGLDGRPLTGPSDVPALSTSSEADTNSAIWSAVLAAAAGSTSLESPNLSLLSGSSTTGSTFPDAVCAVVAATAPSSPALSGLGTRDSSTTSALAPTPPP